jgi:polysaccharide export outer membrane protein
MPHLTSQSPQHRQPVIQITIAKTTAIGFSLLLPLFTAAAQAQTPLPPSRLPNLNSNSTIDPALLAETEPIPMRTQAITRPIDDASYYIGPGDELRITVVGYPEYTGIQTVLSDGTIALPVLGNVIAADRTPAQLTRELTALLDQTLVNPSVSVNVNTQRPVTINIAGEVQRPGPVQLRNLQANVASSSATSTAGVLSLQRPTITSALLEAGGVTREADLSQVVLRRYSPNRSVPPQQINLWETVTSGSPARDITLQDGDTLYVPKLTASSMVDPQLMAKSSLAPRTVRVKVVGEVKRPGEVAVPPDGTISSAIAIAGGPTDKAKMKEVRFMRRGADGKITEQKMDLNQLSDTIQIQDGDVVYVPITEGDKALGVANQVVSPLNFLLRLFGL